MGIDICANNHKGNPESVAAFHSLEGQRICGLIRHELELAGKNGMTCDELEVTLQMRHQTVSSRCSELLNAGVIIRKPLWPPPPKKVKQKYQRRRTRSRRWAAVLVLAELYR